MESRKITPRELSIVDLIAKGHTNKSIAHELKIAYSTVVHHRENIYNKLDVSCTADLLRKAVKLKLIEL